MKIEGIEMSKYHLGPNLLVNNYYDKNRLCLTEPSSKVDP